MFLHVYQISLKTERFSEGDLITTSFQLNKNNWYMLIKYQYLFF